MGYEFYFWLTRRHVEVDFVLYGNKGLLAFEIKRKQKLSSEDFRGLKLFGQDYPIAKRYMFYGGSRTYHEQGIEVIPFEQALINLKTLLS